MKNHKLNNAPWMAWLLAAVSAPLAWQAGKGSWAEVLIAGIFCTVLNIMLFLMKRNDFTTKKWYAVLQCVFISLVAGLCLRMAGQSWPTGNTTYTVPGVLLLLAVYGAWEGSERASRSATVLMWVLILLYLAVVAGGVRNVKLSRLETMGEVSDGMVYLVFLLPAVGMFLPKNEGSIKLLWLAPAFGVLLSVLVMGTLSENVAMSMENPFYEFGKSLSLFGVVERFESLVSVALTIGYYCLLSLLLSAAYHLAENTQEGSGKYGVILTAIGAAVFMKMWAGAIYPVAIAALVIWYTVPVIVHKMRASDWSKTDE